MGIITADGTPMILVYSPNCTPLDAERTYSWSTIDNKPETNATTNCISMIMDINGNKKPNRFGKDVRTLNSFFGAEETTSYTSLSFDECDQWKDKLGIKECRPGGDDAWAGAVKYCYEKGLHLPSTQTLALAAGAKYGRTDITPNTVISTRKFAKDNWTGADYQGLTCEQIWKKAGWGASDQIICVGDDDTTTIVGATPTQVIQPALALSGSYWSASESSATSALKRYFSDDYSRWGYDGRNYKYRVLCLGD